MAGVLRFPLASPLRHVSRVEWLTFESGRSSTIDLAGERLFFSEDLRFFEAVVPPGSYTLDTLKEALEQTMACALARQDGQGPLNTYEVRVLPDSSRVSIAGRGPAPFAVHVFQEIVSVQRLSRMVGGEWKVTFFSSLQQPMARGSVVELFHPSSTPTMAQVLHALGKTVVVRRLEGPDLSERLEGGWTMRPLSHHTMLPELLGLGNSDQSSSTPLPIVACSGMERFCIGTDGPHGLAKGDLVVVDGVEGLCGTEAVVETVVSEQQVTLRMNVSENKMCKLTCVYQGRVFECFTVPSVVSTLDEIIVEASWNAQLLQYMDEERWTDVKMLPPYPSFEWGCGRVSVRKGREPGKLLFRLKLDHPRVSEHSSLRKMAIVGVRSVIREKQVLFLRMWMGLTEAYGVSSTQNRVFGRAQMKKGGLMTSTDHSVVGVAQFWPPLEKVSFVETSFVTSQGQPIPPNLLGEYSMLLRIEALP